MAMPCATNPEPQMVKPRGQPVNTDLALLICMPYSFKPAANGGRQCVIDFFSFFCMPLSFKPAANGGR